MTELIVRRQRPRGDFTPGELLWNGNHQAWTCEDVIREIPGQPVESWKVQGKTAIPSGRYQVILDYSNRFQRMMPHVLNVPGFSGIRIHIGNYAKDTDGCLLLGEGLTPTGVSRSTAAFEAFMVKFQVAVTDGEVWITYVNPSAATVLT